MTPQLTLLPTVAAVHVGTAHLTEDQFGELLVHAGEHCRSSVRIRRGSLARL